jgi:hypothetical protein
MRNHAPHGGSANPAELETIEYMGHSFRIWPEIIVVNGAKKKRFNLAIDDENGVRRNYEQRTYAIMEGQESSFRGKQLSYKIFCSAVWGPPGKSAISCRAFSSRL